MGIRVRKTEIQSSPRRCRNGSFPNKNHKNEVLKKVRAMSHMKLNLRLKKYRDKLFD